MLLGSMHQVDVNPTALNKAVYEGINSGRGTYSATPKGNYAWNDGSLSYKKTKGPGGDFFMERGRRPASMGPRKVEL